MVKTIGYILLIVSCLAFLMILVIPWLGFSKIQIEILEIKEHRS
jgi:hypothetical protein